MKPLLIKGMHGLGDNLHQRAIVRQLMSGHDIWLESSWIAPYHDLVAQGLKIVHKPTTLRTQAKNAQREHAGFSRQPLPRVIKSTQIWYRPADVRVRGSVLAAMCASARCDYTFADFRLPVPEVWREEARKFVGHPTQPILIYRPLVERTEWNGCAARNPDADAYAALLEEIRASFHVVSIADLVPGAEWMVGRDIGADVEFHRGELPFEALAGLFSLARLVFCSPGFAVILAQAVGTPVACVFGHYERAYSFSGGARFSPYLGIEPRSPRDDFRHDVRTDKSIDLDAAVPRMREFCAAALARKVAA
jgi:hypothetical protein